MVHDAIQRAELGDLTIGEAPESWMQELKGAAATAFLGVPFSLFTSPKFIHSTAAADSVSYDLHCPAKRWLLKLWE